MLLDPNPLSDESGLAPISGKWQWYDILFPKQYLVSLLLVFEMLYILNVTVLDFNLLLIALFLFTFSQIIFIRFTLSK
jgi:hypothetical protein